MRWLLPLILVVALAICAADPTSASARKRARAGQGGPAWMHPQVPPSVHRRGHDHDVAAFADHQAAALQTATFDAATGTLTWFDDDYCYN
jgi:hypothetical protein